MHRSTHNNNVFNAKYLWPTKPTFAFQMVPKTKKLVKHTGAIVYLASTCIHKIPQTDACLPFYSILPIYTITGKKVMRCFLTVWLHRNKWDCQTKPSHLVCYYALFYVPTCYLPLPQYAEAYWGPKVGLN